MKCAIGKCKLEIEPSMFYLCKNCGLHYCALHLFIDDICADCVEVLANEKAEG